MNPSTIWLGCGVLRAELEKLHRDGRISGELRFLDSMLHMDPQRLQALLGAELTELGAKGSRVVLVYGDCCSRMMDLVRQFGISRVNAINCAQMLVGRNRYRELMRDQAFMLLPEWAPRWKEIMQGELGLPPDVARDLMRENRRELVYLDTAVAPVPRDAIEECAAYTGLPWRVEKVTLDDLLALLLQAESGNVPPLREKADASSSIYRKPATWADQVMMADVFSEILASSDPSRLAQIMTEQMRELTGAHTAILIAHPEGVHSHRVMHVSPARRGSLLTTDELTLFCPDLTRELPLYVKDYHPEHPCRLPLLRAGVSSLMRFPLRAGDDLLATMLLLDLPGADRIEETEKIITHLTPVMALALKNSLTHEQVERQAQELANHANKLEQRVAERTQALKESEEKYRTLIEHAGEAIFVAQDGRVVFVNPMTTLITGYSGEEIASRLFVDFIHADDRDMVRERHAGRLKGEAIPPRYSFRVLHKDGGFRWVELDAVMIDWEGKPATLNFMSDITHRRLIEEKEKETHALLRIAGEKAKLGGWIANLEENRVIWSDEVAAIHGMPAGYSPLVEQGISFYAPEWKERITKVFTDCAQKGIPYDEEMEIIAAGGKRVWVRTIGEPVKDKAGKIVKVQGAFQDITDGKRAEEALLDAYRRLNDIIDFLPDATFVIDCEGKVIAWNRAMEQMTGIPKAEMIGKGNHEYALPFYGQRRPLMIDLALLPDDVFEKAHYENIFRKEDNLHAEAYVTGVYSGKGAFMWGIASRLRNASGTIIGAIESIRDITDRKSSMDRMRKALGGTVQAIVSVVEAKDPYTAGHQRRVADISRAIATEMGLSADRIEGIRMAGIIHDIGKVSIPAEILSMPRKLTDLEFGLIKAHAKSGYDILNNIEFPWPIARIVLEHHERMNGSGYPNGLTGDQILQESRIMAVADVVEAMATHRPYRPAMGLDEALEEITINKGLLYDPEAVDACLRLFREKGFTIKE